MYTSTRLEWHQGDELVKTPQGTVWSCRTASESFDQFNRLAVALAKSQDHRASCGVFAFWQTVLHTIARPQPGGVEEKGTRYVERLGGSSRIIRATGLIIKSRGMAFASMMILHSRGKVPSLSTLFTGGRGVFG